MTDTNDNGKSGGGQTDSALTTVFNFFSEVLKSITSDDFLRVLWGVEVLLLIVLIVVFRFGDVTGDQRFIVAVLIIASIVVTFAISAYRKHERAAPAPNSVSIPSNEITRKAQRCFTLLMEIEHANDQVIHLARSGNKLWEAILNDTYGHICSTCHQRRLRREPPDAYLDTICAEPAVSTVCDRKWELGEAVDDYRNLLNNVTPRLFDHADLELLIRRSVTQPDCSPLELQGKVRQAIERAKPLVSAHSGP